VGYFKDKVIWITGATSGIGEALAKQLAGYQPKLILSARRKPLLQKVAQVCIEKGAECLVLPLDVSQSTEITQAAETVNKHFSYIDILINNAGISQRSYAKDTLLEVDRKIMEVNYFGNIALTKAVLPKMLERNSGQIVVMSSVVGHFGFKSRSTYAASKHALHGFYETLYIENQDNDLKVNIICPGRIQTNISVHSLQQDGKEHGKMDPHQAKGMPVNLFAKRALSAIERNKRIANIGNWDIWIIYIKKYIPALFYYITKHINDK